MSISATTTYAELARGAERTPVGTNVEDGGFKNTLSRITAFVPTEAIATYVTALGILTPNDSLWRWLLLLAIGCVAVFLCVYYWWKVPTKLPRVALLWSILFALVGLVAWAAALPSSPFFSIPHYTTAVGGIAVAIISPLIPPLAEMLHVAPKS